jgi:hypothetical protein
MGIRVKYLEKPKRSSFADIQMEKFRILTLTEYKRVMFLDADMLPLTNFDYLMELSDPDSELVKNRRNGEPLIQPNFVIATRGEPANGGCFMLAPRPDSYKEMLDIVEWQRETAKELGYPFFNRGNGWGHSFFSGRDQWDAIHEQGKKWRWHGSHVDQGTCNIATGKR